MFDPLTRTLTLGGQSFKASPVSVEQVRAWVEAHDAAERRPEAARLQERALRHLLRLAFPARLSMLWRGDPVSLLLAAPTAETEATMAAFFLWAGSRQLTS